MIAVLYPAQDARLDPLARVLNRSLLEWHLALLKRHGFNEVIVTGFRELSTFADAARRVADYWRVTLDYHQTWLPADLGEIHPETGLLCLELNHIYDGDLSALLRAHAENRNGLTLAAPQDPVFASASDSPGGSSRPPLILNAGVAQRIASVYRPKNLGTLLYVDELQDAVRLDGETIQLVRTPADWSPVYQGYDLFYANQSLVFSGRPPLREIEIAPRVYVGCDSQVHETARLEGPLVIGERCFIGPHAQVGPGVIVEDDSYLCGGVLLHEALIERGGFLRPGQTLRYGIFFKKRAWQLPMPPQSPRSLAG